MGGQKDGGCGRSEIDAHTDQNANDHLPTYRGVWSITPYKATTAIEMSWQIVITCSLHCFTATECSGEKSLCRLHIGNIWLVHVLHTLAVPKHIFHHVREEESET